MPPSPNLYDQLAELYALQVLDEEIAELTERRRALLQQLKAIHQKVEARRARLEALRESFKHAQVEQRRRQLELESLQTRLARYREQLDQAKDANEYLALQKQIETSTTQADQLEEAVIAAMLELDAAQDQLHQEETDLETFLKEQQTARRERVAAGREVDRLLEIAREKREQQAARVEEALLERYHVRRQRRKTTMVAIAEKHTHVEQIGRNQQRHTTFTCSGCHMNLPLQLVLEAQKFQRLYECPTCHRILWVRDPLEPSEPEPESSE